MKKRLMQITSAVICVCLIIPLLCSCSQFKTRPSLWLLEGEDGNKIYFFGSIHIADSSLYPLGKYITDAYDECDYLAVEYDIIASEKAMGEMSDEELLEYYKPFMYTDGTTIEDHIGTNAYETFKSYLQTYDCYYETLDYYKPYMWESMMTQIFIEQSGLSTDYGVDRYFIKQAYEDEKTVLDVESEQFQLELITSTPNEIFIQNMETMMYTDLSFQYGYMLDVYKRGRDDLMSIINYSDTEDSDFFSDFLGEDVELEQMYEEYNKAMLDDRNIAMAKKAEQYLNEGKNVFFVVGAAHMVSEKGIIEILRDKGYKITKI